MAESAPAPSPSFSGIDFNPSFFPSTASDYLEFPVAQGTETFGTIYATTIDTPTPTADFTLLGSATANVNIGTSVPSLKKIKLGANTGTTVQCGSIDCTGPAINNAVDYLGGDLSLGAGQTTGILNLGTGFRTTTGNGGGINIGTLATGTIPITIGTTGQTTTTLRGTAVNVTTKITAPTVDSPAAATNMFIGDNLRGGNLTIGGGSGHTGTINIGSGQTSGALNIGNGARTNTATINIGTQAALSAAMGINIGTASNSYTNLYGSNVLIDTKLEVPIINAKAFDTVMTIGSNLTSGSITIGGTAHTGDISLGAGQTSGDLFIGTGIRTSAADINIGTGSNGAGNIFIGHKGTTVSTQAVKINTSTGVSIGSTTIGSSTSATTIDGTLAVTGLLTANGGLTIPSGNTLSLAGSMGGAGNISTSGSIATSSNISTSGSGTITSAGVLTASSGLTTNGAITLPTASYTPTTTQLGYTTTGTLGNVLAIPTGGSNLVATSNLPIGKYMITFSATFSNFSLTTGMFLGYGFTVVGCSQGIQGVQSPGSVNVQGVSLSGFLIVTAATNSCTFRTNTSAGTVDSISSGYAVIKIA